MNEVLVAAGHRRNSTRIISINKLLGTVDPSTFNVARQLFEMILKGTTDIKAKYFKNKVEVNEELENFVIRKDIPGFEYDEIC